MGKSYWLYLEPYTIIHKKRFKVLLTNTLDGNSYIFKMIEENDKLVKELMNPDNNYCIEVSQSTIDHPKIKEFIAYLRKFFLADYVEKKGNLKPFIMIPTLNLQNAINRFKNDKKPLENDALSNLTELFLYLSSPNNGNKYSNYRQYLSPFKYQGHAPRLKNKYLRKIIDQIRYSAVNTINILDEDLLALKNEEKKEIIELFNSLDVIKIYHFNIKTLIRFKNELNIFDSLEGEFNIHLLSSEDFNLLHKLDNLMHRSIFTFSIDYESDIHNAKRNLGGSQLANYEFKPHFNGSNISFFKKNVFLEEVDILQSKIYKKDIFMHKTLNDNDFGRLHVFSNGDIFANVNNPKIGNIEQDSLKNVVSKEMMTEDNWRKTRNYFPCSNCLYQFICPSPTNYEKVMNTNLCINGPF